MTQIQKQLKILDDFPPVPYEDWKAAVVADLKGVPFEKKMISRTDDGIAIEPLYCAQDWAAAGDPSGFPGLFPLTRGTKPLGQAIDGWDVRQEVSAAEPIEANRIILQELSQGVNSIELKLDGAACAGLDADDPHASAQCGRDGVMLYTTGDLKQTLADVQFDAATVSLEAGAAFLPAAALLAAVWEERGLEASSVRGAFNADPLAALVHAGALPVPMEVALAQLADLAAWTSAHLSNVTSVRISTAPYHHAGSSSVQDLAFAVATTVEYLRAMTTAGLDVRSALRQIVFHESIGCRFYQAIARLRALRKLLGKVMEVCGVEAEVARHLPIVVETSRRVITQHSHWVNLLRNTATCFAGAVAGVDAMITLPMDAALGASSELTRRLARNTQLILQEECQLNQVVDPAGGSWFIESLTDQMAEKAWSMFTQIEGQGGMLKAVTSGWVAEQISAVEQLREKDIATRKKAITGVSTHPVLVEEGVDQTTVCYGELRAAATGRLLKWRRDRIDQDPGKELRAVAARPEGSGSDLTSGSLTSGDLKTGDLTSSNLKTGDLTSAAVRAARRGATLGEMVLACAVAGAGREAAVMTPLPVRPYAAAFEQLRDRVDEYARTHGGQHPRIFLAQMGTPREFLARATYAQDFFKAGGIEPLQNDGFKDAAAAAEALKASGADMAVICSTDTRYATEVEELAPALRAAGARLIVLAGNPGANEARYRNAGVAHFIFIKCNALEVLRTLLGEAGVP